MYVRVAVFMSIVLLCFSFTSGSTAAMYVSDDYSITQAGIGAAVLGDTGIVRDGTYSGHDVGYNHVPDLIITPTPGDFTPSPPYTATVSQTDTPTPTRTRTPTRTATFSPTSSAPTTPTTITVPGDYPNLLSAYTAAHVNDTILVSDGTYSGAGNRDILLNSKTVIFQSVNGPEHTIIDCGGSQAEPHRAFSFFVGLENNSVIDGFTIRNGYASSSYPIDKGGAICCNGLGFPTIMNCIITNNYAVRSGGGISCDTYTVTISNCEISHNTAAYGGGIAIYLTTQNIYDCVISNNTATSDGGGIYTYSYGKVNIQRCEITNNRAHLTGGGISMDGSSHSIIGNTEGNGNYFANNYAAAGADLYYFSPYSGSGIVQAQYNTFEGYHLSDYYVSPQSSFNLTNCVSELVPITQDAYVSPSGDNSNSGLTPEAPFRTIGYAMSQVFGTEEQPVTVHLAPGEYSPVFNIEAFPLPGLSWVTVAGAGSEQTILDADQISSVFRLHNNTSMRLTDMLITGGMNDNGGALYLSRSGVAIESCAITGNTATYNGGGMWLSDSSCIIRDCSVMSNTSENLGGAICCYDSSVSMFDSIITNNSAENDGGALFGFQSPSVFANCLLSGNTANRGGALYAGSLSDPRLHSCTLVNNNATGTQGSALYGDSVVPIISNSILWDIGASEIYGSTALVFFSDIKGGYTGDSVINSDPLFVEGPDGLFYLSQISAGQGVDSPCLDTGGLLASEVCFDQLAPAVCLDTLSTRSDQIPDSGIVDMGFHYPSIQASPTPSPQPSPTWSDTETPAPSETPTPTETASPTDTATPTQIPSPTPTTPPTLTPTQTITPPTSVPTPTNSPTASPELGVELVMPSTMYVPGDPCWLKAFISNPGPESLSTVNLYVALDLEIGYYWFYPSWTMYPPDIDFVPLEYVGAGVLEATIIPEFEWPAGVGSYSPVHFYGALVDSETGALIGSMGAWTFGYGV